MKPKDWDKMSKDTQMEYAIRRLQSPRGMYIIGQALARATEVMKTEKYPEESNIEDMEVFGETIFSLGYGLTVNRKKIEQQAQMAMREMKKKGKKVRFKGVFSNEHHCGYCHKVVPEPLKVVHLRTGVSTWESNTTEICRACVKYLHGNYRNAK